MNIAVVYTRIASAGIIDITIVDLFEFEFDKRV
jgi:hypothetical protein